MNFSDNGHDENDIVDENIYRLRLGKEDIWMKMLRNDFSCGLKVAPTSTNFYVTGRSGERYSMS